MQELIVNSLEPDQKADFERQVSGRNLEQALSRLRRIATLLADGSGEVDGLTAQKASELDRAVCRLIVDALAVESADLSPVLRFAAWAARADYHDPVEVFTVNYDLLLETAFESLGVPYFDGFIGALRARFRTELVENEREDLARRLPSSFVRLWKLHGSVHWAWEEGARLEVVRLGSPVTDADPAAIYPSDSKYDESRRVPFLVLQDRFRRALHHPETLLVISGYAFGDAHLNEVIFDAARRRPRSEFIAFCFSVIPDKLAAQAAVSPNLQAIAPTEAVLAGVRSDWEASPDLPSDLWDNDALALGNFANLAGFLARSSPPQGELEAQLQALLAQAASRAGA